MLPNSVHPPWTKLGRSIESGCRKALFDFGLIDGQKRIAVALSGGKDSLTLLLMLNAIRGRGFPDFDLYAIHVGGEFSCGAGINRQFLEGICEQLNVTYLERESTQKLETLSCYPCSRERRRLLFDAAKEVGCSHIAFGHHRDDNAQTLMMNLLHKGEFAGMLPKLTMEHYGVTVIRPLIYLSEEQIRSFAQLQGFARVMCRCPVGQHSMRRQVDQLIDQMEGTFPNVRKNLADASLLYGSDKASRA